MTSGNRSDISISCLSLRILSLFLINRSAINTLQFAAMRCKKEAEKLSSSSSSAPDVSRVLGAMIVNGLKDEQRDAYAVWRQMFSTREANAAIARRNKQIAEPFALPNLSMSKSKTANSKLLSSASSSTSGEPSRDGSAAVSLSSRVRGKAATVNEVRVLVASIY